MSLLRASEPSHDELFAAVGVARSRGVGNDDAPLDDLAALLWAAQHGSPESQEEDPCDADKIEYILRLAVSRLGGKSARTLEALLGLSRQTRSRTVKFRREEAAKLYGKSRDTFRVHFEPSLLMAVATHLRVLVDERRLAVREAQLTKLLRTYSDSHEATPLEDEESLETEEPPYPFAPFISQDMIEEVFEEKRRETYLQLF
jgi:hypothetical protein